MIIRNKELSIEDITHLKKISSWSYRFYSLYLRIFRKEDSVLSALQNSIGSYPSYVFRKLYKLHLAEESFNKVKAEPDYLQKQKKLERAEKRLMSEAVKYSIAKITYIKNSKDAKPEIIRSQDEYESSLYFLKGYSYYKRRLINDMKGGLGLYEYGFYTNNRITKYASHSVINSANLQNDGIKYKCDNPGVFLVKEKLNHIESLDVNFHVAIHFANKESFYIRKEIREIDIGILNAKAIKAKKEYTKYYNRTSVFKYLFHKFSYCLICLKLFLYGKPPKYHITCGMDLLYSQKNTSYEKLKSFNSYGLFFNSKAVKKQFIKKVLQDKEHIKEEVLKVREDILKEAISQSAIDVVDKMLQDFNMTQNYASEFLSAAAGKGQEEMLCNLFERQCIVQNIGNDAICRALTCAIEGNYHKVANILITRLDSQGVSRFNGHQNNTALVVAATHGNYQIVDWLLNNLDINVNTYKVYLKTESISEFEKPLDWGESRHKSIDYTRRVIGPTSNDKVTYKNKTYYFKRAFDVTKVYKETALIAAVKKGHDEIVSRLLKHKEIDVNLATSYFFKHPSIYINDECNYKKNALMYAAYNGHNEIVKLLLEHPYINVNIQGEYGLTALMYASYAERNKVNNYTEIVDLLLKRSDIDVNIKGIYGYTALILAAIYDNDQVIIHLLKHPRINVNSIDERGHTALIGAAKLGYYKATTQLLKSPDIDVNIQCNEGETALTFAAKRGHYKVVSQLIRHPRINVNSIDEIGRTALMAAVERGDYKLVGQLIRHPNINVNIQFGYYRTTALIMAVEKGYYKIVSQLIMHEDIDINIEDIQERSALYYAIHYDRYLICTIYDKAPFQYRSALMTSILLSSKSFKPNSLNLGVFNYGLLNLLKYMLFSGKITFDDFKKVKFSDYNAHEQNIKDDFVKDNFVKKVDEILLFLKCADISELKLFEKKPSKADVVIASIIDKSFTKETIEKYSGMKMSRFVAVRELMKAAKITNILYKFNYYIFINMLMLRNNSSPNPKKLSIFEGMPFDIKTHLLEFIIGEGVSEIYKAVGNFKSYKTEATSSVSLLENNSSYTKDVLYSKKNFSMRNICVIS